MKSEIKYIGFYQNPFGKSKRIQALSAANKMDYIASALNEAEYKVHIISPSWMERGKNQPVFEKTKKESIYSWKKLTSASSWNSRTKLGLFLQIIWSMFWLFAFLVINTKRDEKILVYHSPWFALPVIMAKRIKKFNLILEVEEIYSRVWTIRKPLPRWEKMLIDGASSYLIVSESLEKYLPNKPKIVVYGCYETDKYLKLKKPEDEIRIVYAGLIDDNNGGAFNLVDCVDFLPDNYIIKIIGYGNERDIEYLKAKIYSKNSDKKRTCCGFYGVKRDDDYTNFLSECDIGVNSQINGQNMQTAFPSKILSYMTHNLAVVSTPIESVMNSLLASYICFSEDNTPESIASAITRVDFNTLNNPREKISKLHLTFVDSLRELMTS